MTTRTMLPVEKISVDEDLQQRDELNQTTIDEYAELMNDGAVFPAVSVVSDGVTYWLTDGLHRLRAAEKLGRDQIDVEIIEGDYTAAMHAAARANATHGLQRRDGDRIRAAMLEIRACHRVDPVNQPTYQSIRTAVAVGDSVVKIAFARLTDAGLVFAKKDPRGGSRSASFAPMEQNSEGESVAEKLESVTGSLDSRLDNSADTKPDETTNGLRMPDKPRMTDRESQPMHASWSKSGNHSSGKSVTEGDAWAPVNKVLTSLDEYMDDNARDDIHMAVVFAVGRIERSAERVRITDVLDVWGAELTRAAELLRAREADADATPTVAA